MDFSEALKTFLSQKLNQLYSKPIKIESVKSISGGDINDAYCLFTNEGKFFIKSNLAKKFPDMFNAEAKGLKLLAKQQVIEIPDVISVEAYMEDPFLILEFIESGRKIEGFSHVFGQELAALHRKTHTSYGLDFDNYMGSLFQKNSFQNNWFDFFISNRLDPQYQLARNNGYFSHKYSLHFDNLYKQLQSIVPNEVPALIHGDLWGGNYMVSSKGKPCLIDPAVYYGHRESDIAMTKLFGGFEQEFYDSYNDYFPLEKNWKQRIEIFNLYPLLIHVNLFGRSYEQSVAEIIRKF